MIEKLKAVHEDIHHLPKGTTLLDFQRYIKNIPLVLKGSVKVLGEDSTGKEMTLYHIKPGESCVASILGAINQSGSMVKAVTIEDTELLLLRPESMQRLIRENPEWFSFFIQLYQTRFEELLRAVTNAGFKQYDERIVDLLRERGKLMDTRVIEITHKEIADEFGTSREVISRVMKKLEAEGKVKIGRGKILLK